MDAQRNGTLPRAAYTVVGGQSGGGKLNSTRKPLKVLIPHGVMFVSRTVRHPVSLERLKNVKRGRLQTLCAGLFVQYIIRASAYEPPEQNT